MTNDDFIALTKLFSRPRLYTKLRELLESMTSEIRTKLRTGQDLSNGTQLWPWKSEPTGEVWSACYPFGNNDWGVDWGLAVGDNRHIFPDSDLPNTLHAYVEIHAPRNLPNGAEFRNWHMVDDPNKGAWWVRQREASAFLGTENVTDSISQWVAMQVVEGLNILKSAGFSRPAGKKVNP